MSSGRTLHTEIYKERRITMTVKPIGHNFEWNVHIEGLDYSFGGSSAHRADSERAIASAMRQAHQAIDRKALSS